MIQLQWYPTSETADYSVYLNGVEQEEYFEKQLKVDYNTAKKNITIT